MKSATIERVEKILSHASPFDRFLQVDHLVQILSENLFTSDEVCIICGLERIEILIDERIFNIDSMMINEEFGEDFSLEGDCLNCVLYFKKLDSAQLANVNKKEADFALEVKIALNSIWVILAKTTHGEKILYRG